MSPVIGNHLGERAPSCCRSSYGSAPFREPRSRHLLPTVVHAPRTTIGRGLLYLPNPSAQPLRAQFVFEHRRPCRNIRSGGTSPDMMLPIPSFPWLAAAPNSFPWRSPMDANGWHHILAANMLELKKEVHDSPLVHTDGSSDGTDCVVCGDKSSGKHYGQFSCEGCKSFFKRSIRRSLSYTCRAAKNCAIDVQHRNQCQYCRLKKCIRMGMRKEGRRSHETQTAVSAVQRGRLPVQMPSFFPPSPFFRPFPFLPSPPMFNPLMAAQLAKLPVKESIYEFAAQTIFATVNWARTSMTNLTKADQLLLLRHSWTPIFVFALAHSNFALNLASHLSESGSKESSTEESTTEVSPEHFQTELDKLREYHLDIVEISSLRAILLFSCHEEQLEEKSKISEIVDKLEKALEEYCRMNKGAERFVSLRECLKLLRTTGRLPISRIFFSRLLGTTPLESILSDLLTMPPPTPQSLPLFPLIPRN